MINVHIDKKYFYLSIGNYRFANWKSCEFTFSLELFPLIFSCRIFLLKKGLTFAIGQVSKLDEF